MIIMFLVTFLVMLVIIMTNMHTCILTVHGAKDALQIRELYGRLLSCGCRGGGGACLACWGRGGGWGGGSGLASWSAAGLAGGGGRGSGGRGAGSGRGLVPRRSVSLTTECQRFKLKWLLVIGVREQFR